MYLTYLINKFYHKSAGLAAFWEPVTIGPEFWAVTTLYVWSLKVVQ